MRICLPRCWIWLAVCSGAAAITVATRADDGPHFFLNLRTPAVAQADWIVVLGDGIEFQNDPIRLANQVEQPLQPPESPMQPLEAPFQPLEAPPLTAEAESPSFSLPASVREALELAAQPKADVVGQGEVKANPATDLGSILKDSENVQTVAAQRRSQVAFDPHVRGYKFGQIYAQSDGEYFLPVRLDLDSMLNKIDPSLIQTVTVIPGPYGLRYGPGFSFIDVVTVDTPRSCCGFEWTNRFGFTAWDNGGQTYGRDTITGAGENYGFITHFGMRDGADYTAGNGEKIPSSYHNQNALLQLGFDVNEDSRVEFRYNRLDLRDTEYAVQFFDVSYLATDSFNLNYIEDDPYTGGLSMVQVWYNQSRFNGNNTNPSKREVRARVAFGLNNDFQTTLFNPGSFSGFVNGNLTSFGARAVRTYGEQTGENLRIGADVRYIQQSTREQFFITDPGDQFLTPDQEAFSTNQPHSSLTDPGVFAEWTVPWGSFFKSSIGGRVDWVNTHPRSADFDNTPALPGVTNVDLVQNDVLLAGYASGEMELTMEWSVRAGLGYAERVPDLVNRYADGVFLGILQNGFSKVAGFPALRKERATQADISLTAEYDWWNARASAFYSWINDYNTYASFAFDPPTGAQVLLATNTGLAELNGFELYADYQLGDYTTVFGSAFYVEGFDEEINRPLPAIYPLEGRLGLRWQEPSVDNIWGLEWGFRFVAAQDRIGFLRDNLLNDTTSIPVESATPSFYTSYVRGYYNLTPQLNLVGGIDNLFDRTYIEHLDLRLPGRRFGGPGSTISALAPGFTAYAGLEWEI
jgi:iron complex outermembrane receptor protein